MDGKVLIRSKNWFEIEEIKNFHQCDIRLETASSTKEYIHGDDGDIIVRSNSVSKHVFICNHLQKYVILTLCDS